MSEPVPQIAQDLTLTQHTISDNNSRKAIGEHDWQ